MMKAGKRAALYARFSSDLQKDKSIDRQFADLEKAAERLGLALDHRRYFSDRAQTATSLFDRPGLTRELLGAAKGGDFDVVLVEATDRLSRNRADLFWLAEQFKFDNVKIFTPGGEVSDLQLTFDGHMNSDFIAKLAYRVKSGQDAVAREGLIPGKVAYGYACVSGKPGLKAINPDEAKIVIRIFEEYASGKSPRQIAADLMRDKIPSPTGGPHWLYQSIVGGSGNKRGMLHNQLYVGLYLKNRYFNVKNPSTGKTITRKADPGDLIKVELPHLRIVSDDLWNAAHAVRAERGHTKIGKDHVQRAVVPRRNHLLAGLLRCGACNERMIINFSDRKGRKGVCCSAAHGKQTCHHRKTYSLDKLTALAIDNMHAHLTDPEFLKERAKAKALEFARLEKENRSALIDAEKRLDRLNVQIAKLVRALDDDDAVEEEIRAAMKEKAIERKGLQERVRLLKAETSVTTLHPTAITAFSRNVETLHGKLKQNPEDQECRIALANILDSVIVHPTAIGGYEVSLYARLSAVMGVDLFPAAARSLQDDLQDRGLEACLHRRDCCPIPASINTGNADVFFLGRWRAAA